MTVDQIVTPEMRALVDGMIGKEFDRRVAVDVVTTSEIRRWAIATMDDSPLWYDEQYAAATRFGVGCAPGAFPLRAIGTRQPIGVPDIVRQRDFDDDVRHGVEVLGDGAFTLHWPDGVGVFHAGNEVEYFQFARLGDRIFSVRTIVGLEEKTGRSGRLAILYSDRVFKNQVGDVLVVNHGTTIAREMPKPDWTSD